MSMTIYWKHLDISKPEDGERCLVWDKLLETDKEDITSGISFGRYSAILDRFFGEYHGVYPRIWAHLNRPEVE